MKKKIKEEDFDDFDDFDEEEEEEEEEDEDTPEDEEDEEEEEEVVKPIKSKAGRPPKKVEEPQVQIVEVPINLELINNKLNQIYDLLTVVNSKL